MHSVILEGPSSYCYVEKPFLRIKHSDFNLFRFYKYVLEI